MTHELTRTAERDIKAVLTATLKTFGTHQFDVYAQVIARGLSMVGEDPMRVGSIDHSEIAHGVRLFHLELAAGRRGAAAHCVYYKIGRMSSGATGTIILRILHESMEPRHKVIRALRHD